MYANTGRVRATTKPASHCQRCEDARAALQSLDRRVPEVLDEVPQIRRLPSLRRGAEALVMLSGLARWKARQIEEASLFYVVAADRDPHARLPEPPVRALLRMQPCPCPHARTH